MSRLPFDTLFNTATGNSSYDYQSRLMRRDFDAARDSHQLIDILACFRRQSSIVFAKD